MRWNAQRKGKAFKFHSLEAAVGDYVKNYLVKEDPYL